MTTTRSVALLVLVATVGLTIAPVASGAVVGALTADTTTDTEATDPEANTSVSMFMQSSAAETEHAVDDGMFEAKYDAADNDSRTTLVRDRTATLENRLEALEAEREQLRDRKDELNQGEYQARMTRLTVEIRSLDRAAGQLEPRAADAGVSDRVATLQSNAAELTGPEVAEIARGLAGPEGTPGGGSADSSGPPADTPGTESTTNSGAEPGSPADTPETESAADTGAEPGSAAATPETGSNARSEADSERPKNDPETPSSPGTEADAESDRER
ncbi:hypothetical protein [Natronorubrum thiooxidans]|uniref:Uncharacterized protein n=1 Tax=Natronorubrum thiooxidans TaxID=308853 RepID=A0A1N7G8R5_9EURY|nr:hypothetical protein [Natronorubrum thiooxidans]SIS08967.1 hypothetical protein SAMN05421752_110118 [Natronorubrum thiooxidans]